MCEPVLEFQGGAAARAGAGHHALAGIGNTVKVVVITAEAGMTVLLDAVEGVRAVDPVMTETAKASASRAWHA
ncbi:ABC transporter permease subunit OS=Streptomyces tendae OX=1932 GN=GUR47_02225 PE=3 SV=1 [Streptomyces tendae]